MPAEELAAVVDSPAFRDALITVLERTDGGKKEIDWADVNDSLSRQQWGRLLSAGIVVGGESGFRLDNPERVRGELSTAEDATHSDTLDIEFTPWTRYDKLAGIGALVLMMGYWNTGIRNTIAAIDDVVLGPITATLPFYLVVLLLAVGTGVYSTMLQTRLRDTETAEKLQERIAQLKERKAAAEERNDEEALAEVREAQQDAAGEQLAMMKAQFRPMVWIMLLTIPVFLWLRWNVQGGHLGAGHTGMIVPLAGAVTWQSPLIGPMPTWLVWYFVCSLVSRQGIQKLLGSERPSS